MNKTIEELLVRWAELQKPSNEPKGVGPVRQHYLDEIEILQKLLAAGCRQIPNEPFDVPYLIDDRKEAVSDIDKKLSDY